MIEAPDKRVWFFLVPAMVIGLVFLVSPPTSTLSRVIEPALYATTVVIGIGLAALSIRDGYSLLRPGNTMTDAPFLFWLDVGVGCVAFSAIGMWNLFKVVTGAA